MKSATFLILTAISIILLILLLRKLTGIFPSLLACVIRGKENINLESSVKLKSDRNIIATAMVIPFCLLVSEMRLYNPAFVSNLHSEGSRILVIASVFIAYIIIRAILAHILYSPKRSGKTYGCASSAAYTFFIILTILLLGTCWIFSIFNAGTEVTRKVMLWLSAAIYLLFLIRKYQIFTASCSIFTGILYLCALEILPTGALIASAVFF